MKDYYKILRIPKHSNQAEIKRAYRRLAIVFHPDKNPSKEASFLFQEINEAHEILSDPTARARYDQLVSLGVTHAPISAPPQQPQFRHRDPAYRRTRPPGYRPAPAGPSERLLMMAHFLKYLRPICFIGIGWCGLLFVDYLLPPNVITEKVVNEGNRISGWKYHHVPYVVVTDQGHQFQSSAIGNEYFPVGSNAHIVTSRVLHLLIQVEADNKAYIITTVESVYGTFIFVPIILLLGSFAGLALKEGIEFRFSVQIALCMALFFNFIFLIFSIL